MIVLMETHFMDSTNILDLFLGTLCQDDRRDVAKK